jgi:hypothetical protein
VTQRIQSFAQKLGRVPTGWWVVLLTLPAIAPLARSGFFESHDGLFHAYRLSALDRAVRAGVLYPRWFPEFAFGYGHPVLNFYGPLSYYWGLPFTLLGADATLAVKLVFASGLVASGLGMYLFARSYLDRAPALVAAVVYAYLPYHLVDLYVRGALAEFLAFVWFPLVLWTFRAVVQNDRSTRFILIPLAALSLAALVVTHSLSALIFAPVLLVYLALLLIRAGNGQALGAVAASLALAVALSAFYWLPVLAESQYVGLGSGASQGYQDHLVTIGNLLSASLGYAYPTETSATPMFPLGLLQVAILVAGLFLAVRRGPRQWIVLFFLSVGLVSTFMLLTVSEPVWRLLEPGLAFLQYPWRFQALIVLATAFLAGALCASACQALRAASCWSLALVCCVAVGAWSLWHLPFAQTHPSLSVEAMWQRDRDQGQVGATWTGEYLPVWVQEQRWALARPVPEPTAGEPALPAGQVQLDGVGYTRAKLTIDAPQGERITLHQFHYPSWQAKWQDDVIPSRPEGALGLATFDLPPGQGSLDVRLATTTAQMWGTVTSLITALMLSVTLVAQFQLGRVKPLWGTALLCAWILLLTAVLVASMIWPNGYVRAVMPVRANLEDTVEVLAYSTEDSSYRPGDTMPVTVYWRALRDLDKNYKTFVHLTDADVTRQPAQHDGDPNGGFTPTTRWVPGEIVPDTHALALPEDLAPGLYRLWAGMYDYETLRNLDAVSPPETATADRVLLGEVEVVAP